jgi:hypothetical protein
MIGARGDVWKGDRVRIAALTGRLERVLAAEHQADATVAMLSLIAKVIIGNAQSAEDLAEGFGAAVDQLGICIQRQRAN